MVDKKEEKLRTKLMRMIEHNWPTHVKELLRALDYEVDNSNIKKLAYHVKQLKKEEKIMVKKIGQALVIWPYDMEKLRVMYEMLKED